MKQLSLLPEPENNWTSDDWQTPDSVAIAMSKLINKSDRRILEPCAATGQIAKFLPIDTDNVCCEISLNRWREGLNNASWCHWLNINYFENYELGVFDLIIGNPPFSRCVEFIERSLQLLNTQNNEARILFLLPLDWNCSKARAIAWKRLNAHIHHLYQIEGRVAFLDANGVPQTKRQVCDAVFDIRPGRRNSGISYL